MDSQVTRFTDPRKRVHEITNISKASLHDILLKAANRKDIPDYYSRGSLILSEDTLELFAAKGYGTKIEKVSDVEIGGSVQDFTRPGVENKIYIATVDPKGVYVWSDKDAGYHQVSNTNDEGDYCYDSDIVYITKDKDGNIGFLREDAHEVVAGKDDTKWVPLEKGRTDKIYIDTEKNELYRFDPSRISDKDEQDGGKHDIKNGMVQVAGTAPLLEIAFNDYKKSNNAAVKAVTDQAAKNAEDIANLSGDLRPRMQAAEQDIENLRQTKASKEELSDTRAELIQDLDEEAKQRQQVQANLDAYKIEQAAEDKKQDDALTAHNEANQEKFKSLDQEIAQLKADLYAHIREIDEIPLKQVAFATGKEKLGLPASIGTAVDDGTKVTLAVDWTQAVYDPSRSGEEQVLTGTLLLPKWVKNDDAKEPSCRVLVGADPHRNGNWTVHRFILPLMATSIKGFKQKLGLTELSNEDVFGEGYANGTQEALSKRHFELRLIGATFQGQTTVFEDDTPLILDDAILDNAEHNYLPAETYKNGVAILPRTASLEEQEEPGKILADIGFCSDKAHPYWNGSYSYDEATDTLRFTKMGQSTALVYEARKLNDGYIPYPTINEIL